MTGVLPPTIGTRTKTTIAKPTIGWREWVCLPDLEVAKIKAKVDTGARSSSLHAIDLELVKRRGVERVIFKIHPLQDGSSVTLQCDVPLLEQRWVKSSNGKRELRPVIRTELSFCGALFDIDLTLTSRDMMGFRMLLGREAVRGRFLVDPGRSFLIKEHAPRKRKKQK